MALNESVSTQNVSTTISSDVRIIYQLYNNLTLSLQGRGYSQRRTQGQVTGLSASTKPASQEITTFRTHFGRYCYKRLPFGLCVSQDILQQAMDRILARAPCCVGIADHSVSAANHVCRTIIKRRKRSWKLTYHRKVWCACLLRDNTPCRVYIEDTHTDTVSIFEHRSETLANGVTELFGKPFVIITDHKTLLMIHSKPLKSAHPRLQRLLIKIQGYDFQLVYRPTTRWKSQMSSQDLPTRKRTLKFYSTVRWMASC